MPFEHLKIRTPPTEAELALGRTKFEELKAAFGVDGAPPRLSLGEWNVLDPRNTLGVFWLTYDECLAAIGKQTDTENNGDHCCYWNMGHFITRASSKARDGNFVEYYHSSGLSVQEMMYRAFVSEVELAEAKGGKSRVGVVCNVARCIHPKHLVLEKMKENKGREVCHRSGDFVKCPHEPKCLPDELDPAITAQYPIVLKKKISQTPKPVVKAVEGRGTDDATPVVKVDQSTATADMVGKIDKFTQTPKLPDNIKKALNKFFGKFFKQQKDKQEAEQKAIQDAAEVSTEILLQGSSQVTLVPEVDTDILFQTQNDSGSSTNASSEDECSQAPNTQVQIPFKRINTENWKNLQGKAII